MKLRTLTWITFCGVVTACELLTAATLRGRVVDADSGETLAARVYLYNSAGKHFHVQSSGGTAIPYDVKRSDASFEIHTTVSADPFQAELPEGEYTLLVEKGKEYFPASREFILDLAGKHSETIRLQRWANMARQGWYSGETHVHREVAELPTLQLAEDLNVAFPLTAWVTDSEHTPAKQNKNTQRVPPPELVRIDPTHVFWPVNTEYEIFTVRGRRHTLGAVFVLNHRTPLQLAAPPVGPIAAEARSQGAFLELDKHNWPWSMMLVPQMQVELFELANNHLWRTSFHFTGWYPEYVAPYMLVEMSEGQFTERGWIDFGFQNYYALLNSGFRMQPTAGTASGVHPVPFGYGRVYVKLDGDFTYEKWVNGLLAGNSFVTTGPLLTVDTEHAGENEVRVRGKLESATEPDSLEIIVNGHIVEQIDTDAQRGEHGQFVLNFATSARLEGTSWLAVRAYAKREGNRVSFAHTAPAHFRVEGKPLRPSREERDYLARRVRNELARHREVLPREALNEYEDALRHFESIPVHD